MLPASGEGEALWLVGARDAAPITDNSNTSPAPRGLVPCPVRISRIPRVRRTISARTLLLITAVLPDEALGVCRGAAVHPTIRGDSVKVILVGGGPVSSLAAAGLRRRGAEVTLYERHSDPRSGSARPGHSFNITLTRRGLRHLTPQVRDIVYGHGVVLSKRVIHRRDGSVETEHYGIEANDHLLTISRSVLARILLTEAEAAGADVRFGYDCIGVDAESATVRVVHDGRVSSDEADLIVGCDGAGSTVRQALIRCGGRLDIHQEFLPHGHVELNMPAGPDGRHVTLDSSDRYRRGEFAHGMHVWPRGDYMLIAQPNIDGSYTVTLFMPHNRSSGPTFRDLRTAADVTCLFTREFPDAFRNLPALVEDFFSAPASPLRTVNCYPFHHKRAVLLGDAAHTIAPFFGQGINCSFEDVGALLHLVDGDRPVHGALESFSRLRAQPSRAIADLSLAHLLALASHRDDPRASMREQLERELHELCPDRFAPLYWLVAFSDLPYDEAVARYQRDSDLIDWLCTRFDPYTERHHIVRLFQEHVAGSPPLGPASPHMPPLILPTGARP